MGKARNSYKAQLVLGMLQEEGEMDALPFESSADRYSSGKSSWTWEGLTYLNK